ncbi:hypothetical protein PFISCL1PPCAC_29026, partial [Pristionchus fissidentatus]
MNRIITMSEPQLRAFYLISAFCFCCVLHLAGLFASPTTAINMAAKPIDNSQVKLSWVVVAATDSYDNEFNRMDEYFLGLSASTLALIGVLLLILLVSSIIAYFLYRRLHQRPEIESNSVHNGKKEEREEMIVKIEARTEVR